MKNKAEILIIPHNFQEHYSIGFANAIARNGFTVHFIGSNNMNTDLLLPGIQKIDLGQNPEIRQSEKKKNPLSSFWRKLIGFVMYHLRLLRHVIIHRNSIVHVIGLLRYALITGILEGCLFRIVGRKYVLTVHDLLPHDRHTRINRLIYGLAYKIPHCLVVHTERMRNDLIGSFNIEDRKIIVMQHGLNDIVPDHGKEKQECRKILNLSEDKCVLLFFGRIIPYKGVDILLDGFKYLTKSDLVF